MWRKPTESDLAATLSQKELDTYRQSSGVDGADPVADLLSRTAEMVRGYCRSNRSLKVSSVPGSLPEGLISPAMDYAAYDVLKRLPVKVGEDRRLAKEAAVALFEKVADGKVTPEDADDGENVSVSPGFNNPIPPRVLD